MKKSTKKIMILYSLILVATLLCESILANAIASTFTISSGVYPGAPAYTIWKEGVTCYAKNGYGSLVYSSTNASEVINEVVIADLSIGGKIFIKSGYYELTAPIKIDAKAQADITKSISIVGESLSGDGGFTKLQTAIPQGTILASADGYTGSIFLLGNNSAAGYFIRNLEISHLEISGHSLPYSSINTTSITMTNTNAGIKAYGLVRARLHDLIIINSYHGIRMSTIGNTNDDVYIYNSYFSWNVYGVKVDGATEDIAIWGIRTYLNYAEALDIAADSLDMHDVISNADGYEQEDFPYGYPNSAILITAAGFMRLQSIYIVMGANGQKNGLLALTLIIGVINSTITVSDVTIFGSNGYGVWIGDTDKRGWFYLNNIYASPSDDSYQGGDGDIGISGIVNDQNDSSFISVTNSVFQYSSPSWPPMWDKGSDFSYISNTYNGTAYIQEYP